MESAYLTEVTQDGV